MNWLLLSLIPFILFANDPIPPKVIYEPVKMTNVSCNFKQINCPDLLQVQVVSKTGERLNQQVIPTVKLISAINYQTGDYVCQYQQDGIEIASYTFKNEFCDKEFRDFAIVPKKLDILPNLQYSKIRTEILKIDDSVNVDVHGIAEQYPLKKDTLSARILGMLTLDSSIVKEVDADYRVHFKNQLDTEWANDFDNRFKNTTGLKPTSNLLDLFDSRIFGLYIAQVYHLTDYYTIFLAGVFAFFGIGLAGRVGLNSNLFGLLNYGKENKDHKRIQFNSKQLIGGLAVLSFFLLPAGTTGIKYKGEDVNYLVCHAALGSIVQTSDYLASETARILGLEWLQWQANSANVYSRNELHQKLDNSMQMGIVAQRQADYFENVCNKMEGADAMRGRYVITQNVPDQLLYKYGYPTADVCTNTHFNLLQNLKIAKNDLQSVAEAIQVSSSLDNPVSRAIKDVTESQLKLMADAGSLSILSSFPLAAVHMRMISPETEIKQEEVQKYFSENFTDHQYQAPISDFGKYLKDSAQTTFFQMDEAAFSAMTPLLAMYLFPGFEGIERKTREGAEQFGLLPGDLKNTLQNKNKDGSKHQSTMQKRINKGMKSLKRVARKLSVRMRRMEILGISVGGIIESITSLSMGAAAWLMPLFIAKKIYIFLLLSANYALIFTLLAWRWLLYTVDLMLIMFILPFVGLYALDEEATKSDRIKKGFGQFLYVLGFPTLLVLCAAIVFFLEHGFSELYTLFGYINIVNTESLYQALASSDSSNYAFFDMVEGASNIGIFSALLELFKLLAVMAFSYFFIIRGPDRLIDRFFPEASSISSSFLSDMAGKLTHVTRH